jgi:large subunit ribosomal protein L21
MFAIVRTGGKQYRVVVDGLIRVEKLAAEPGSSVTLDEVLMVADGEATRTGAPTLVGAAVTAEVVAQGRDDKIIIFKKKRRHNYRRKNGHRQAHTVLRITGISAG